VGTAIDTASFWSIDAMVVLHAPTSANPVGLLVAVMLMFLKLDDHPLWVMRPYSNCPPPP
jgi:hypothetical protein